MKRAAIFILCLILAAGGGFTAARATEQTVLTFDGAWWTGLTRAEKLMAVEGMIVGFGAGYGSGTFSSWLAVFSNRPKTPPANIKALFDKIQKRIVADTTTTGNDRNFGTMVDELDNHFEGHDDRQKESVSQSVWCALTSGQHCKT